MKHKAQDAVLGINEVRKHKIVRWTITAVIFLLFAYMFVPFAAALLMAALFAFALNPLVNRFAVRRSKRRLPTAILLLSFFLLIIVPITLVASRIVAKVREYSAAGFENAPIVKSFENFTNKFMGWASTMIEQFHLDPSIIPNQNEVVAKVGGYIVAGSTAMVTQFPEVVLGFFVFTAGLYYFLMESRSIRSSIERWNLLSKSELTQIIREVQKSSYESLVVTSATGAIQASIVAVVAYFCGYTEFFVVFVVTFLCSFIPVIGAGPIAFLLSLVSFAQGENGAGITLLVTSGIAGSIDNIIKPYLINSADEDLHPVISLLAVVGGVIVYGVPGLLLGPILTRLTIRIIPILFANQVEETQAKEK